MLRGIVTLRCPRCRRGALFTGILEMPERCAVCGLYYEREHGYFVGAMAISLGTRRGARVPTVGLGPARSSRID